MIAMFTNYQNLSEYYTPNNLAKYQQQPSSYTKFNSSNTTLPYELYNAKGALEGYFWNYGETITLDFSIDGYFTINADDQILYKAGETPSIITEGRLGQKIYNIIDYRSWECKSYSNLGYIWEEDPEFTYPLNTKQFVYIDASDYLKDKKVLFKLYNFRCEEIYSENLPGNPSIKIHFDTELSKKLVRGIYYCSLEVIGNNSCEKVFDISDCKLLIK